MGFPRHVGALIGLAVAVGACRYTPRDATFPSKADGDGAGDVDGDVDPFPPADLDGSEWVDLAPAARPPLTWLPAMTYHPARRSIVFYGGGGAFTVPRDELWELQNDTWVRLCEACPPGALYAANLVYDTANERLLLFGGSRKTFGEEPVNALWSFADGAWMQETANATTAPSPRWGATAAYDSSRHVFVVFGGEDRGVFFDDLWELHDGEWFGPINVPGGPAARAFAAGAYSRALDATLVYGGGASTPEDDAWTWNGSSWGKLCDACSGTPRFYPAIVHVPEGPLLLVGGYTSAEEIAGTRIFQGGSFVTLLETPSARDSVGLAYDEHNRRVVLFGGNGDGCGGGDCDETLVLMLH